MMNLGSMLSTMLKTVNVENKSADGTREEVMAVFASFLVDPTIDHLPPAMEGVPPPPPSQPLSEGGAEELSDLLVPAVMVPASFRLESRPLPEVASEPVAPLVVLDGKEGAPQAVAPRVLSPVEMPLPNASLVDEKAVRLEELVDRFDQRVLSLVQRNETVTRITIRPATMGRLTILCREENATLSVEIVVQNHGVRELIAGQEDAVRRLMQAHSVELGSFNVQLDQRQSGGRSFGSRHEPAPSSGHGIAPATKENGDPSPVHAVHKGGVVSLIA